MAHAADRRRVIQLRRALLIPGLLLFAWSLALAQQPVSDDPNVLPRKADFDAFGLFPIRPTATFATNSLAPAATIRTEREERLGVPTFLWAAQGA